VVNGCVSVYGHREETDEKYMGEKQGLAIKVSLKYQCLNLED